MKKTIKDKISDKLVNAFVKNKIISAIPRPFTKNLTEADKFRKLCESKIQDPIIGFKAGGTGIPLIKKLKEKEPFVASVFTGALATFGLTTGKNGGSKTPVNCPMNKPKPKV